MSGDWSSDVCSSDLISEMVNKGIPRPTIVFFNSIMNSLCKEGSVMDAHDIFNLVVEIGGRPNLITFNSLIDGYFLVGNMEKAIRVLDTMVSVGIEPDIVTYNTLLGGYLKIGRIDDGLILFREIFPKKIPEKVQHIMGVGVTQGRAPSSSR